MIRGYDTPEQSCIEMTGAKANFLSGVHYEAEEA
jgi:hypothetical protein